MIKKPAIDGVGRPQGFLDDIVRPIIQKGARKVKNSAFTSNLPRNVRAGISRSARKVETEIAVKRSKSYWNKANKAYQADKSAKKVDVLMSKARAAQDLSASVRKAAKGARRRGGYR